MSETKATAESPMVKIDEASESVIEVSVLAAYEVQSAVTACEICGPDGPGY